MKWPKARYHMPLGVFAAGGVLLIGAILPHTRRLHAVHAECAGLQAGLTAQTAQVQSVAATAKAVAAGREKLGEFAAAVPRGKQFGSLLAALDGFARTHELREFQVRPGAELTGGPVLCVPVEVEFAGGFASAYAFLRDVERLPRVAWVQRCELSYSNEVKEGLRGALTLLVYHRPEAEETR